MHRSKLFRALVIGGGMTAAALMGCGDEAGTNPQQSGGDTSTASQDDSTDATESGNTDGTANNAEGTNENNSSTDEENSEGSTDEENSEGSTDEQAAVDGELTPCFCNAEPECCEEVDGEAQAVEGFECCWGTSC